MKTRDRRQTGPPIRERVPSPKPDAYGSFLLDAGTWVVLFCATLLAYWPALRGSLLWDDNMHVTRPDLQSLHGLWRIWFDLGATQQYYPLLHSAFWLEHRIWGDAAIGYHLTNVALHATAAFLVILVVLRLSLPGAWLAGFLFALHPVCVEAVAWVSEQKSTLSAVFYLAAALTYLSFDRTRRRSLYFLAAGFFVLALLSKTVTATLPAVLLVIFWWQRGRLEWKRDVFPLLPWLVAGAGAGLLTAWVESAPQFIGAQGKEYALSVPQRLLLAGRVPWFYASKLLWPWDLMFVYPRWKIEPGEWWQYLFPIGLVMVAAGLVWRARNHRGPLACFLIYTGTLFPVLGFLNVYPFRYSYVADHFQYLASLALLVPAAIVITSSARRFPTGIGRILPAALLLTTLGFASWRQSGMYRDYETLFRATLARNPGSAFLHNNLGVILMSSGREREAADAFREAVRLAPESADYHVNLGLALSHTPGRMEDAIAEYRTALRIDPELQAAHLNLGLAYTSMPGRLEDAIAEYHRAISEYRAVLQNKPNLWEAHFNLGLAYAQLPGRDADAISEFRIALEMKPDSALTHFHLGNTFHKTGRLAEAIAEYQASLRLDPAVPEVHYELAYALAQIPGRISEAIAECQKMLLLKPDDQPGRQLLASLLAFQDGRGR